MGHNHQALLYDFLMTTQNFSLQFHHVALNVLDIIARVLQLILLFYPRGTLLYW